MGLSLHDSFKVCKLASFQKVCSVTEALALVFGQHFVDGLKIIRQIIWIDESLELLWEIGMEFHRVREKIYLAVGIIQTDLFIVQLVICLTSCKA